MELCLMFESLDKLSRLCETGKKTQSIKLVIINTDKTEV